MRNTEKQVWKWFLIRVFLLDIIIATVLVILKILQASFSTDIFKLYIYTFPVSLLIIYAYDSQKELVRKLRELNTKDKITEIIFFAILIFSMIFIWAKYYFKR